MRTRRGNSAELTVVVGKPDADLGGGVVEQGDAEADDKVTVVFVPGDHP